MIDSNFISTMLLAYETRLPEAGEYFSNSDVPAETKGLGSDLTVEAVALSVVESVSEMIPDSVIVLSY